MEDTEIVDLYLARDEDAIARTEENMAGAFERSSLPCWMMRLAKSARMMFTCVRGT